MRLFLCFLAAAVAAEAGVVRGVVQEHVSGLPMARTFVRLFPVPRGGAQNIVPMQVGSDRSGQFLFSNVPEGLYLPMAVREGYFPWWLMRSGGLPARGRRSGSLTIPIFSLNWDASQWRDHGAGPG